MNVDARFKSAAELLPVNGDTVESYDDFVQRAAFNPIGRRVKLADLEDNSNLSRVANPTEKDFRRLAQRAIESIRSMDEVSIQNKEMGIEPSA